MVVSWSLCRMLGYINLCKILQFLMSFTRKALHPQMQECGVICHVSVKMTQLSLTCLLTPMYISTVSKNLWIWWMTMCWHLVILNKMGWPWKNPKSFYQGRIISLSLSLSHTHTHTFMTCSTSYCLCDTHASTIYMCVLASIPVSRNGSPTLVTIQSAERQGI